MENLIDSKYLLEFKYFIYYMLYKCYILYTLHMSEIEVNNSVNVSLHDRTT